jgi:hypothetical protein
LRGLVLDQALVEGLVQSGDACVHLIAYGQATASVHQDERVDGKRRSLLRGVQLAR